MTPTARKSTRPQGRQVVNNLDKPLRDDPDRFNKAENILPPPSASRKTGVFSHVVSTFSSAVKCVTDTFSRPEGKAKRSSHADKVTEPDDMDFESESIEPPNRIKKLKPATNSLAKLNSKNCKAKKNVEGSSQHNPVDLLSSEDEAMEVKEPSELYTETSVGNNFRFRAPQVEFGKQSFLPEKGEFVSVEFKKSELSLINCKGLEGSIGIPFNLDSVIEVLYHIQPPVCFFIVTFSLDDSKLREVAGVLQGR
jgi:hypothetical protein